MGNMGNMGNMGRRGHAGLDQAVRSRIAEIMSAAGVDRSRVSQELLFELPDSFVKAYELLYDRATQGMDRERRDDGQVGVAADPKAGQMGGGGSGRTKSTKSERAAAAGRSEGGGDRADAATDEGVGSKGGGEDAGGGGRYDRVVVRSGGSARRGSRGSSRGPAAGLRLGEEEALRLKERIDKRLRGVARDILEELDMMGMGVDMETGEIKVRVDQERLKVLRNSESRGLDDAQ